MCSKSTLPMYFPEASLYLCISPRPRAVQTNVFWWAWYRSPVTLFAIAIAVPCVRLLCLLGQLSMRTMAFLVCLVAILVSPLSIRIIGTKPFWGPDTNQPFEDSGCSCWIQVPTSFSGQGISYLLFFLTFRTFLWTCPGQSLTLRVASALALFITFLISPLACSAWRPTVATTSLRPPRSLAGAAFSLFCIIYLFLNYMILEAIGNHLLLSSLAIALVQKRCSNQALLVRSLWHSTHVNYQLDGGPNNYILQSYCMPWNL